MFLDQGLILQNLKQHELLLMLLEQLKEIKAEIMHRQDQGCMIQGLRRKIQELFLELLLDKD
jgi:ATP-dependent Lon protease